MPISIHLIMIYIFSKLGFHKLQNKQVIEKKTLFGFMIQRCAEVHKIGRSGYEKK